MSGLSLRVAVIHRVSKDALMEEAHELIENALGEIEECLEAWGAFLEYVEPAQRLMKLPALEQPLKMWKTYHRVLGEVSRELEALKRERDFSKVLRGFHESSDPLRAWAHSNPPIAERLVAERLVFDELWNSPTGSRLADKVFAAEEGPRELEAFYREHR